MLSIIYNRISTLRHCGTNVIYFRHCDTHAFILKVEACSGFIEPSAVSLREVVRSSQSLRFRCSLCCSCRYVRAWSRSSRCRGQGGGTAGNLLKFLDYSHQVLRVLWISKAPVVRIQREQAGGRRTGCRWGRSPSRTKRVTRPMNNSVVAFAREPK